MSLSRASILPPAFPEARGPIWRTGALVALAIALAYANSLRGPFVFDDLPAIAENASIRQLWPLGPVLFPDQAGGVTTSGRPVTNLTLALNHALSGERVGSYHVVNVAIHLAAALTLLGLVRRTLLRPGLRRRFGAAALPLATAVALGWALHPLPTAAVTYVVQRAEALAALAVLLTLYCFVRAVDSPRPVRWHAAGLAVCALGMACKETMAAAPVLVLLYDRTFVGGSWREAWRQRARWHAAMAATWLVLGALVLATGGSRGGTAGFGTTVSAWSYALTQCSGLVTYAGLAAWPYPLVFDYGLATVPDLAAVWPQAMLVLGALVAVAAAWRCRPAVGFLGTAGFLLLAPSSSVIPIATQTLAEHRCYLPLAAGVAGGVVGIYVLIGRHLWLAGAIAAVALAGTTLARNGDYQSELNLWGDTAAKLPANARAHNNLGQAQFRAGRIEAAIRSYERALARQPKYPETHYNLGVARLRQGEVARAIAHYEDALRFQPDYPEALNNLGNALQRAGRPDEARRRYEEAVARRPDFAAAQNNLGNALLQAGRPAEARARFERAQQLQPADPETSYNLGNARAAAGDMTGALACYRRALELNPRFAAALVNAGNALLELKRPAEALAQYEAALALDRELADAHFNRGSVLLDLERWTEAVPALEAAWRLKPEASDVLRALGFALAQTGRAAEAISHYDEYLRRRPDDTAAREERRRLQSAGPTGRRQE